MLSLVPWRNVRELLPVPEMPLMWMPSEFERLANRLFNWPVMETPEWRYPMTTEEGEKEVVVRVELPGFAREEVKVEMLNGRLAIEAEHKPPTEGAAAKPEEEHIRVRRAFTLPEGINPEGVEAMYRNGILEVHLPRTPEATPRRIEVST